MFLDAKLREQGQSMKDLMLALTPSANATTPMGTNVPTKGPTIDEALKTLFGSSYGEAQFKADFKANGVTFISDIIPKGGIGSISEVDGVNGGGLTFGASKTDAGFIADSGNPVDTSNGFKYNWDSSTLYDSIYNLPYKAINRTITNTGEMKLQMGANSNQNLTVIMPTITFESLGLNDLDTKYLPDYSLSLLDGAINVLSNERSKLGAIQNRLEHAYESVMNTAENLTAADSRIRDTDMAKEMMNFTKQNILMQAARSMLS